MFLRLPRISWFMILFGFPVALGLMAYYMPLAEKVHLKIVLLGFLCESISTGIFVGSMVGVIFHHLFGTNLQITDHELKMIRVYSSSPITVLHPISFFFISEINAITIGMSITWLVALIDLIRNYREFEQWTDSQRS